MPPYAPAAEGPAFRVSGELGHGSFGSVRRGWAQDARVRTEEETCFHSTLVIKCPLRSRRMTRENFRHY